METLFRFYLATVLAAFTLAPTAGITCPAHKGKTSASTTSGKKVAKKTTTQGLANTTTAKPAPAPN